MAEQLEPSDTERYAQLLSLAAHEFRTPASVVGGYLRMLQRDTESPLAPRHKKMVDEAEKACARLVELVAELSEVGKLDSGRAPVKEESFDLFEVVADVAEGVHEARDREVHLRVSGETSGARLKGDLVRLRSAFAAFFRAVLREQPGACSVVAERRIAQSSQGHTAIVIISEASVVQSAYNAPAGAFDEWRGGLGLALPIGRRVVERQGGRIWSPFTDTSDQANQAPRRAAIVVSFPLLEHKT